MTLALNLSSKLQWKHAVWSNFEGQAIETAAHILGLIEAMQSPLSFVRFTARIILSKWQLGADWVPQLQMVSQSFACGASNAQYGQSYLSIFGSHKPG